MSANIELSSKGYQKFEDENVGEGKPADQANNQPTDQKAPGQNDQPKAPCNSFIQK